MPSRGKIEDKPIFIGAGEFDRPHGLRARGAAASYARWGAVVSIEQWPGTDHIAGWSWYVEDPMRAYNLRAWLRETARPRIDARYEAD